MKRVIVLILLLVASFSVYASDFYNMNNAGRFNGEGYKAVNANKDILNTTVIGRMLFGIPHDVTVVDTLMYLCVGYSVVIFNISDKNNPVPIGNYDLPDMVYNVFILGDRAYVADYERGIVVLDISDPTNPVELGYYDTGGTSYEVEVVGDYAYVADGLNGLRIIDIVDPTNLVEMGWVSGYSSVTGVKVVGNYAYISDDGYGLYVVDISDPTNPTIVGSYNAPSGGQPHAVDVSGNYAYLADDFYGLRVVDISDPTNPIEVGYYDTSGGTRDVKVAGDYAYLADNQGELRIIKITNPDSLVEVGSYQRGDPAYYVCVDSNYVYITYGSAWSAGDVFNGFLIIDVSDVSNPNVISYYDTGGFYGINMYIVGDYCYVTMERRGFYIMDVSNSKYPEIVGYCDIGDRLKDVYVYGNYAYLADDGYGLYVVDITDPSNPYEVAHYDESASYLSVMVEGDYAYVAASTGGVKILDVSDLTDIKEVSVVNALDEVEGVFKRGDYLYISDGSAGFRIVDISDMENPVELSRYTYLFLHPTEIYVEGDHAYVLDNAWYSGGIHIMDISDPTNPIEVMGWGMDRIVYGISKLSHYIFMANENRGLRIFDIADTTSPVEVAYYDDIDEAYKVITKGDKVYISDYKSGVYIMYYDIIDIVLNTFNTGLYYADSTYKIEWTADSAIQSVEISYSTDDGYTWTVIDTVENTGSYDWKVPHIVCDRCRVKLVGLGYDDVYDISDNIFSISYGTLTLENLEDSVYYAGDTVSLRWNWKGTTHNVIIYGSADNGVNWFVVDTVENTGGYNWYLRVAASDSYKVKIQSLQFPSVYDILGYNFKVKGIEIITPASGDTLEKGNNYTIKWDSHLDNSYVLMYYSMDNGETWDWITDSTDNNGEYVWYVSTDTIGECLIRLELKDKNEVYDNTPSMPFNIVDNLEILSPNGGENIMPLNVCAIRWHSSDREDYVNLYYSYDNGNTWNSIKKGILASVGYYEWEAPDIITDSALIKIEDYYDNTIYDVSDNVFSIGNTWLECINDLSRIKVSSVSMRGINIRTESTKNKLLKVKIYDSTGRLIKEEMLQIERGVKYYNISVATRGVYFVKIYDDKGNLVSRNKISVVN